MTEARVAASYVQLLYEHLAALGLDAAALLGPGPAAGEHFVALKRWQALLQRAQALDPGPPATFALRLGRGISPRHFGVIGYAALACGTLAQALQRLERHHRSVYDVNQAQVELGPDGLHIVWGVERGRPGPLVDETALAALMHLTRDLSGKPLRALGVDFVNPRPADVKPYEAYFGGPVRFAQPLTRLTLAHADLALPLRASDSALLALLDEQAERLLQELGTHQALSEPLALWRHTLIGLIRSGRTALADLAQALHLSPRSLQRRLSEQGSSFQTLLDQTRQQLAEAYLRDPELELSEVAGLLGYSEHSALSRAFRQWTGQTPQEWRRTQDAKVRRG
ncbi:AraC family transcriptional regulator [Paucibacter sp. B51]|uniref:AraC family transcriptional regulator n=1 Tax=Paucibacter sp. B51 TaxID=2993315 RepID=UPI0022EBADE6|nr:AraC family transcriptional regulator [Paucibacter sp. B51]